MDSESIRNSCNENVADDQGGDKSKEVPATMENLPTHIVSEVLTRIPAVRSIVNSKLVSPKWQAIISSPQFAKAHMEKSLICPLIFVRKNYICNPIIHLIEGNDSFDLYPYTEPKFISNINYHFPDMRFLDRPTINPSRFQPSDFVISSCDGLLAWTVSYDHFPVIVSNPITGEFISFHDSYSEPIFSTVIKSIFIGIGFNAQTKRYELLRLSRRTIRDVVTGSRSIRWFTEVLTLGAEHWIWRRAGDVSESVGDSVFGEITQVINMNGVIYWIHQGELLIFSFNFERRFFEVVQMPNTNSSNGSNSGGARSQNSLGGLGILGGFLCISLICDYDGHAEVWSMKDNDGSNTWAKLFEIDTTFTQVDLIDNLRTKRQYRPMKYLENGEVFLQHSNDSFLVYDPSLGVETCHFRVLEDARFLWMKLVHHKPSLISLRDALMCDNIPVQKAY